MTTYSDWIIIPKDRKCDLPSGTKVQILTRTMTLAEAEKEPPTSLKYVTLAGDWDDGVFAYRVVQMTTYSEWIIIPADRKCDLPRDTQVQAMWRDENVEYAEENKEATYVSYYLYQDSTWLKDIFAYRVVQEPVYDVREYECWANFNPNGDPVLVKYRENAPYNLTRGTATQTTRGGRPYRFEWQAE